MLEALATFDDGVGFLKAIQMCEVTNMEKPSKLRFETPLCDFKVN
jgi:hypothetical protein